MKKILSIILTTVLSVTAMPCFAMQAQAAQLTSQSPIIDIVEVVSEDESSFAADQTAEDETAETETPQFHLSGTLEAPEGLRSHNAYCVMDAYTGEILSEDNMDGFVYPASTTKIVTVLAMLETCKAKGIPLRSEVEIRQDVLSPIPASLGRYGIEAGECYTLETLLYMAMVGSFGDATYCAAEYVFGSIDGCISAMNEIVDRLGLTSTRFDNVAGLDWDNNYTTAREMALITQYAMNNRKLMEMAGTRRYTVYQADGTEGKTVPNTNALLYEPEYQTDLYTVLGTKTGTTSGYVLASIAEDVYGRRVICTYFGSGTSRERFEDNKGLLDLAFENAEEVGIYVPQEEPVDFKSFKLPRI